MKLRLADAAAKRLGEHRKLQSGPLAISSIQPSMVTFTGWIGFPLLNASLARWSLVGAVPDGSASGENRTLTVSAS